MKLLEFLWLHTSWHIMSISTHILNFSPIVNHIFTCFFKILVHPSSTSGVNHLNHLHGISIPKNNATHLARSAWLRPVQRKAPPVHGGLVHRRVRRWNNHGGARFALTSGSNGRDTKLLTTSSGRKKKNRCLHPNDWSGFSLVQWCNSLST